MMRLLLGCVATLMVVAFAPADDKTEKVDAKKLVGKWEPSGKDKGKVVIEFLKDGKFTVTVKEKGENIGGTYTIDGNKIKIVMMFMGMEHKDVLTVSKFTDNEFETKHEGSDKAETLTRIKDKDK